MSEKDDRIELVTSLTCHRRTLPGRGGREGRRLQGQECHDHRFLPGELNKTRVT